MKKLRAILLLIVFLFTIAENPREVRADGIIIPEPPICTPPGCVVPPLPMDQLQIKYHKVDVVIENQIATTRVDQVFHNPNDFTVEGTYVFPIPVGATVSKFVLWVDGKPVEGKVMDAGEARQLYEDTVRRMADPALLEYIGRGAVQASIYPIPPKEDRRIELEYQQVLTAENGLIEYIYPLSTEKFSLTPLESVTIQVNIRDKQPIRAVYSPSHPVEILRVSDREVSTSYEAANIKPDADFIMFYSVGENEAFHLMSVRDSKDPEDPDGYFMMMLAPRIGDDLEAVAKDIILVLDRSGSMEGEKYQQARSAMIYILRHLAADDRFFLLTFSSGAEAYSDELVSASMAEDAIEWINQIGAAGSTDIDLALMRAAQIADTEKPTYMIFLTDGLPTRGVVEPEQILKNAAEEITENVRVFPFGVGYDVDTFLLDSLAQEHHGLSTYIQTGEALDEKLSAFYEKISTPILTDLEVDFGGLAVYDVYPNPLPDLFAGTQVVITGRYSGSNSVTVSIKGMVNGESKIYTYPNQVFSGLIQENDPGLLTVPRLWATRKIGYLLNQIRLGGPDEETIEQAIKLSLKFGIPTPYTSFLVMEEMPMGVEAQREAAEDAYQQAVIQPTQQAYGLEAVQKAVEVGAMAQAEQPAPSAPELGTVRNAGGRTFLLREGIWVDTTYDQEMMEPEQVIFMSERYFNLVEKDSTLAAAFAMDVEVLVVYQGKAIQVIDGEIQPSETNPPTLKPTDDPTIGETGSKQADRDDRVIPGWIIPTGVPVIGLFFILVLIRLKKNRR